MRRPKKMRSLKMPYAKQRRIYEICQNYKKQPPRIREKIERLCLLACDGNENNNKALFLVLTTERAVCNIASEHFMSKSVLYDLRHKFYELW